MCFFGSNSPCDVIVIVLSPTISNTGSTSVKVETTDIVAIVSRSKEQSLIYCVRRSVDTQVWRNKKWRIENNGACVVWGISLRTHVRQSNTNQETVKERQKSERERPLYRRKGKQHRKMIRESGKLLYRTHTILIFRTSDAC